MADLMFKLSLEKYVQTESKIRKFKKEMIMGRTESRIKISCYSVYVGFAAVIVIIYRYLIYSILT